MKTDITPDDGGLSSYTDLETNVVKRKGSIPTQPGYQMTILADGETLQDFDGEPVTLLTTFNSGRKALEGHVTIHSVDYIYQGDSEKTFSDAAKISFEPTSGSDFLLCDEIVVNGYVTE